MPFDEFFSSKPQKWNEHWQLRHKMTALTKYTNPVNGQFKPGHKYHPKQDPLDTEQKQVEKATRGKT